MDQDDDGLGKRHIGVWDHLGEAIVEDLFHGPDPDTLAAVKAWEALPIEPAI